ncbi:hypothetical protein [Paraoerskovia marina]|uniref:Uncharacterized protein n=1 Tax=Paraoerskovia marina TaxID=545619 RepID=A0A1H1TC63_9CELL|nr:hypothetical protein [Paraoerskovia marina]SDS57852.1 hypothetical protein SAMN04489860_1862 [Paraoerskovia marina]
MRGTTSSTAPSHDRAARARAALVAAERRTGVAHAVAPAPLPGLRHAPVISPRATAESSPASERFWPVHPELEPLLPQGALHRGTTIVVRHSTTLLLSLVAQASAAGAWTVMVGHPRVGMVAAADAGVELTRTALVPAPGPQAPAAIAALLDGLDLVVLGPDAPVTPADRRRLSSRARERGAVLVSATEWEEAHLVLRAGPGTWSGIDDGAGWLRSRRLTVERTGRGEAARPVRYEIELPLRAPAPGRAPGAVDDLPGADGPHPALRLVG